jgi:thiosulfate/3-mercaptopyruvate sulfurtransferase
MLLYLGARDVSLLDGGWTAWSEAGGTVSREVPVPSRGRFDMHFETGRRRTLGELREAYAVDPPLPIDTRSHAEFVGERDEYLPRRGRLPGAVLAPFADLFDGAGRYRAPPAVPGTGRKVAYCEVGVRAALFALLHEIHTGEVIPVYDGSVMEWSLHADLPMEIG